MAELAQAYVQIIPSADGIAGALEKTLGSEAEKAGKSAGQKFSASFGGALQDLGGSLNKAGKGISSAGKTLTAGVTTPIVGIATASTKMALNFEDAMAKVNTIADTTEVPLETLKKQIVNLSNETGVSSAEIAENVYNAISAGQSTGDAVAFVGKATKLATAGFADTTSALDILTTTLNAYGMESSEVTKVSDMLIQTQNMGKTTVGELAAYMGKVIPTAKDASVGLEQITTAYAKMTANGIQTADSTTYLNSMLNELNKAGTTVSDTLIDQTGKSFGELMEEGNSLADVLNILQTAADQNGNKFSDLWSSAEAGKAASVIHDTTNKLGDFNAAVGQMNEAAGVNTASIEEMLSANRRVQAQLVESAHSAGTTDAAFDKMKTTSYNAQLALNQLKNTGIEFGEQVLAVAAPLIEEVTTKIGELSEWFGSLDEDQQQMIVKAAGIAAAAGPALLIGGKAVSVIGSVVGAGGTLIGGIGKLAGKLGSIGGKAGGAVESLAGLGGAASEAAAPVSSAGGAMGTLSQNALGLVAAGAGILLAAGGIALLVQSAIALADAGPGAVLAMVGLTAALAGLAVGAAALAPALTAGAVGLVAFGAGVALVGAGIFLATSGVAILATQLPNIASNGSAAASALVEIGGGLLSAAGGAITLAAGFTVLLVPVAGAAATIALADLALIGLAATFTLSAGGAALLGASMLIVSTSVETIAKDAKTAGDSMQSMVSSVDIVGAAVDALQSKLSDIGSAIANAFTKETPTAAAAAKTMAAKMTQAASTALSAGGSKLGTAWGKSLSMLNQTSKVQMAALTVTIAASLIKLQNMFASTRFSFNQSIRLPHFSMAGSFDAKSGKVPSVRVDWYRKAYEQGYLLNGATIFGAMNGNLLGGGEGSGSELVIGWDRLVEAMQAAGGNVFNINMASNGQDMPEQQAQRFVREVRRLARMGAI